MTKLPPDLRTLLEDLRREVPCLLPVRVYVRPSLHDWGEAELVEKDGRLCHFTIRLRPTHEQVMRDSLMHEWAHCLSWREGPLVQTHGHAWGIAMSEVYTATEAV